MNDRELLKLAARAAQIDIEWCFGEEVPRLRLPDPDWVLWPRWNPLADDGDALRLAAKLMMSIGITHEDTFVGYGYTGNAFDRMHDVRQGHEKDPMAAVRRAIVRAAAEIGKAMPA